MKNRIIRYQNYLKSISISKTRTLLTILGICISIIVLFCGILFIDSYTYDLEHTYEEFKSDVVYVNNKKGFSNEDIYFFNNELENFQITYYTSKKIYNYNINDINISYMIQGCTSNFYENYIVSQDLYNNIIDANPIIEIRNWFIGNTFSLDEIENSKRVVVINELLAKYLFNDNPINKYIEINENYYRIIGVIADSCVANDYLSNMSLDNPIPYFEIYMPYTTFNKYFEGDKYYSMLVKGYDPTISSNFKAYYLNEIKDNDVSVIDRADVLNDIDEKKRELLPFIILILSFVLIISLLVTINTMFFNVKEKIPEIGIRISLGAKKIDIMENIMFEGLIYAIISLIISSIVCIIMTITFQIVIISKNISFDLKINVLHIFYIVLGMIIEELIIALIPAIYSLKMNVVDAIKFE